MKSTILFLVFFHAPIVLVAQERIYQVSFTNGDLMTCQVLEISKAGKTRLRSPFFGQEFESRLALVKAFKTPEQGKSGDNLLGAEKLIFIDGQSLSGHVIKMDQDNIYLDLSFGDDIQIPKPKLKDAIFDGNLERLESNAKLVGIVRTVNGDVLTGDLLSLDSKELVLKNFIGELRIGRENLSSISFPYQKYEKPKYFDKGLYVRLDLLNGDRLSGLFHGLEKGKISMSSNLLGDLALDQDAVLEFIFSDRPWIRSGNVLVATHNSIVEIDSEGKQLWEKTGFNQVSDAQRLENGNIMIVDTNSRRIVEFNSAGKEIRVIQISNNQPWRCLPLPTGEVVVTLSTHQQSVQIYDSKGNLARSLGDFYYPMDLQLLPNGNLLVVESNRSEIKEVSLKGAIVWSRQIPNGVYCARMRENGELLVGSNNDYRVRLYTKDGQSKELYQVNNQIFAVELAEDGGFFVGTQQALIRFDKNGKQKWQYSSQNQYVYAIHEM